MTGKGLGLAGIISKNFIHSKLTIIIVFLSIFIGFIAVWMTPKEEEPQISVPMIDIQTYSPNFEAASEVERKVTEPIERAVWGLDGVEYVYSSSSPHQSLVTVRFKVGESIETSLVKVHHKLMEINDEIGSSILPSKVKSYSIDDVPFLTISFSSTLIDDTKLRSLIAPLARELSATPDLNTVELLGGKRRAIRVIVDPKLLEQKGVTLRQVTQAIYLNDSIKYAGKDWGKNQVFDVEVGGHYKNIEDIQNVAIGQRGGMIVRIKNVAKVLDTAEERFRQSVLIERENINLFQNAVSLSFTKRKGTNVVLLSQQLISRVNAFTKTLPAEIKMSIVRDYGSTAADKTKELIEHLLLATLSVSVLIAIFMGLRASLVIAVAIPVTLALTLAVYYFLGYTLNRVTLFALIFSIGILVDDAIVVFENIERHTKENKESFLKAVITAVSEVGNPTILATFTVIASILPMAFVRGMMGPYMKPIPVGASFAMIISLLVAFIVTPWAAVRLLKSQKHISETDESKKRQRILDKSYKKIMNIFLSSRVFTSLFLLFNGFLLLAAVSLFYFKSVKVKMLPFDNKNEFQILVDYKTTTTLKNSLELSKKLAINLFQEKNIDKIQIYAGEPAPFSFSGMVKHTFLRHMDYQNDLHIVLIDKEKRKESSHYIIENIRTIINKFSLENKATIKILEIPPGPPVLATVVAEIYAPNPQLREKAAADVLKVFRNEPSVVDLDYSWRPQRPRKFYNYNQLKGGLLGTNANEITNNGILTFSENSLLTLNDISSPEDVNIDLSIDDLIRSSQYPFQNQNVSSFDTGFSALDKTLDPLIVKETISLFRKNLKPVSYIMSELSGQEEAPVYGIQKLAKNIHYPLQIVDVPWDINSAIVKWDGEWFITYEVFRDLGLAFAIVLILIYVLVVGWFKSYLVPIAIMAPIPISLIGIIPGHSIFNAYFTATSMIGFIAGAGIIVRNSIILIDFIENQLKEGVPLKEAVVLAGVTRFRPMLLTAAAVIVGSTVILFDPIFQGLAISLMFGEVAATVLSFFAIPILYYWLIGKKRASELFINKVKKSYEN
ncbi:efflux RND transporter permease subunit [Fluviispira sanaruensis]|uniref:AcrB/AcrD/AcrF family protein n=1 Tax=Fluviispira sanaruensis TaxID=2493639 RepID=A0A4P2VIJ0_FLUSA|nr:efflux RND transporter permease subunit [Fluviispira sanaruensis]BBH52238.1 AcrB/AcrD/AcrF family protein [Fluviispira sanaruensis]